MGIHISNRAKKIHWVVYGMITYHGLFVLRSRASFLLRNRHLRQPLLLLPPKISSTKRTKYSFLKRVGILLAPRTWFPGSTHEFVPLSQMRLRTLRGYGTF